MTTNHATDLGPGRPDIASDTNKLWDVLSNGGVAIYPTDMGYGIWGDTYEAVQRINKVKSRGQHKRIAMLMGEKAQREIQILPQRKWDMIDCVSKDFGLPLVVVAKYRPDHPLIRAIDARMLPLCTARGAISGGFHVGGPFVEELTRRSVEHLHPMHGTSANLSGTGVKYRVEDIQQEILDAADIVMDYGPTHVDTLGIGATQIDFERMKMLRWGVYSDNIAYVLKRYFNFDLPRDPGRDVAPRGHVDEFHLLGVE